MQFSLEQWLALLAVPVAACVLIQLIAAPFLKRERRKLAETERRCQEFNKWLEESRAEHADGD